MRLVDLHPELVRFDGREPGAEHGAADALRFDCPEGHENCHTIPFTPAMDGAPRTSPQRNGAQWDRRGDTFETLVLSPSIRRIPSHASRESAIAAGCIPELVTEALLCAFHGFVGGSSGQVPGLIEFCGDSR